MIAATAHAPSPLWYATRGTGAVTLVLLTASVVLGIAATRGWRVSGASLFAVGSLHRSLSLLAVALLAVHIVTTLLDPFPHIGVLASAIPFSDGYRTLWLGLGTLAADILLALVVTSLVRHRLGYGAWRRVHWFAYLCWPVALLHGFGTGSDARATWMLVLAICCVAAVALALAGHLAASRLTAGPRAMALAGGAAAVLALTGWVAQGPLAQGWARRAGTPSGVLTAFAPRAQAVTASRSSSRAGRLSRPFSADLTGVVQRGQGSNGTDVVDLRMRLRNGLAGVLRIRLGGRALPGGGLAMSRSSVSFGPSGSDRYSGRIAALQGTALRALVGTSRGRAVDLRVQLFLNGDNVSGSLRGAPVVTSQ
jgi:methionine sulfoxide reductase heme-binding subunit